MNSAFPMPEQLPVAAPENEFLKFWNLGYHRLVPIPPLDAPCRDDSRIKKAPGKIPGVLEPWGLWAGRGATSFESTLDDVARWHEMGANVSIRTGKGLYAIDADVLDHGHAATIRETIKEVFGFVPPTRVGMHPKCIYLIRIEEDLRYASMAFGAPVGEKKKRPHLIEFLAGSQHFVAHGPHPGTGKPYYWPGGIPQFADLPVVTKAQVDEVFRKLEAVLPDVKSSAISSASGEMPDQNLLLGDPEIVERAVKAMPNLTSDFPTRPDYIEVGYAIKASMGAEREFEALELFLDWCERWDDPEGNDLDDARRDFHRMHAPFKVGASWLLETAERTSGGTFKAAERFLDDPASAPIMLFPPEEGTFAARVAAGEDPQDVYKLLSMADILSLPDPKYLIDKHVPERGVGLLYGAPGTGKSFITLDAALSLAFGFTSWQGSPINVSEPVSVVYLAGEGAPGYKTRAMAWMQERGIPREEWGTERFRLVDESIDFMKPEDVEKVVRSVRVQTNTRVALIVVDTVSTVIPGADENLQKDMTLFVRACRALERAFSCPVWGVHHTNKGGDMRGSSVFEGAGDFIFKLDRKKGERIGRLFCHKMKDGGADGWDAAYRFQEILISGTSNPQGLPLSSIVVDRCTSADVSEAGGLTPEKVDAVFRAVRAACEAGEPWSLRHNVKGGERFYQTRMLKDFQISNSAAEAAMQTWISEGRIAEDITDSRTKKKGLVVRGIEPVTDSHNPSVFE